MVGFLAGASAVTSILGGIKGLFGGSDKPKERTPRDGMVSQAKGAREVAEKYGFNPLTMLSAGAGHGFTQTGGGSAPPLASVAAITDGLKGLDDEFSGDAARRRQADQLEIDLAKVRLDQAKSGVLPGFQAIAATNGVGNGTSPLGRRAATVAQVPARVAPGKFSQGESVLTAGRKIDVAPVVNSSGTFELENGMTGGPVTIPGEGEPWGLDELGTALIVGVPQVLGNHANRMVFGGKTLAERKAEWPKQEQKDTKKPKPAKRLYDGPGGPVFDFKY